MNFDNLRNWFSSVVSDPRNRKVLPVLAVLVAAAIAIPLLLSHSGTASALPPLPPAPTVTATIPAAYSVTPTTASTGREPKQNYLTGPSHNPFVVKTATTAASAGSTTTSATASSGSGGATSRTGASAPGTSTGVTTTVAKAVTVSTPATTKTVAKTTTVPAQLAYSNYEVQVSLLQTGAATTPTVFHNLSRDQLLPTDNDAFATFLGVRPNKTTAVLVLPSNTTVTGAGSCAPSATQCTFLLLNPGQTVTVVLTPSDGTTETFTLSFDKVIKATSTASTVTVDQAGAAAVKQASAYVPQLKTISYGQYTGLLSIDLGSTVPVTP